MSSNCMQNTATTCYSVAACANHTHRAGVEHGYVVWAEGLPVLLHEACGVIGDRPSVVLQSEGIVSGAGLAKVSSSLCLQRSV